MNKSEFDKYAGSYSEMHARNIRVSGETPAFFAEYKVRDTLEEALRSGLSPVLSILDFGSGIGSAIPHFRRYFPESRLTCLDPSGKCLTAAERDYPGQADFIQFDGRRVPFPDSSFDLVFTACVFHHIPAERHEELCREILRILKPGGRLMLFEHNPLNPLTLHAVNTCPLDAEARLIRCGVMRKRLEAAGFGSIRCAYRMFFPGFLRFLRPLEKMMTRFPLGAQYRVSARRLGLPRRV